MFILEDINIIKKFTFGVLFRSLDLGRYLLFKENLTGNKLIEIYEKALLPSSRMIKAVHWILVEDTDPKHTSKVAETWREKDNIDRIS